MIDGLIGLVRLCGFGVALGLPVAVVCSPVLVVARIRQLVGPTRRWPVNYLFVLARVGYDWDPNGYDLRTVLAVGAGVVWYQLAGAVAVLFTITNVL